MTEKKKYQNQNRALKETDDAREKNLENTCDRFVVGALLSVSPFSKSASNSVW